MSHLTIGIHWWSFPFQSVLMVFLAVASYRWIETPLRSSNWFGKRWMSLAFGGGLLVLVSGCIKFLEKPMMGLYLGERLQPQKKISFASGQITEQNCSLYLDIKVAAERCWVNRQNTSSSRIFFVGDSHNKSLDNVVHLVSDKLRVPVFTTSRYETPFPTSTISYYEIGNVKKRPDTIMQRSVERFVLSAILPGDVVVVSIRYPYYFGSSDFGENERNFVYQDVNGKQISRSDYFQLWKIEVANFAEKLSRLGGFLVLSTPTPEFNDHDTNNCISPQWFTVLNSQRCDVGKQTLLKEYHPITHFFDELAKSKSNIYVLDKFSLACPWDNKCFFKDSAVALYTDSNHPSMYLTEKFGEKLIKILREIDGFKN